MRLSQVAQQTRFAAMQPGQIDRHMAQVSQDLQAFEWAAYWSETARLHREAKRRNAPFSAFTPGQHEAFARRAEARVREIALQSEIMLQRRAGNLVEVV